MNHTKYNQRLCGTRIVTLPGIPSTNQMMKLLLFSDVHCNLEKVRSLVERSSDFDVVIGAGDFGVKRTGLAKTIDILKGINRPTVLVPGNGESDEELREACHGWANAHVLHGSGTEIDGINFFGLGGGIPETPFGEWSFDLSEDTAAQMLASCPSGGVLVVHSPPQGVVDRDSNGKRWGSATIRTAVEEKRPRLVVCGHIHDSWETEEELAGAKVINAGPNGVEKVLEA